jgi:hypothetical protein
MRFVLCFLGLVASSLTLGLGVVFLRWDPCLAWAIENLPADLLKAASINESSTTSLTNIWIPNAALVTLVAGVYGFLGSILTMFRCGKQGGMLLLIPVFGAAFMNPISLVVTWFQALVAFGCFFIGPLPINPPADKDADDQDEEKGEMPKPKMKPKAKPTKADDEDD